MTSEQLFFHDGLAHVKRPIGPDGCAQPWASVYVPAREADLVDQHRVRRCLDLTSWPKISTKTMLLVRSYFAQVYELWKTEAFVLFHRADGDDDYTIVSPPWYTAGAGHVSYDPNVKSFCGNCRIGSIELEAGVACPMCVEGSLIPFQCIGTAHSHGSMDAFHSSTDDANELNQTGFHITFGRLDRGIFAIAPSFVTALPGYRDKDAKGVRHMVSAEELIALPFSQGDADLIQNWLNRIAHPGMIKSLLDAGLASDDLAVCFNVAELKDLKVGADLVFIGTLDQLELWKSREAGATALAISWTQAHTALTPKKNPVSTSGLNIFHGGHQLGQQSRGGNQWYEDRVVRGSGTGLGRTSETPLSASTKVITVFDIERPVTALMSVRLTTCEPRLQMMHRGNDGYVKRSLPPVWTNCFRLQDKELAARAVIWAFLQLLGAVEEVPPLAARNIGSFGETDTVVSALDQFSSEVIEYIVRPIDSFIDDCCNINRPDSLGDLDTIEEAIGTIHFGSLELQNRFGKDAIGPVIESIVDDNFRYLKSFNLDQSEAALLEWLRLMRMTLKVSEGLGFTNPAEEGGDTLRAVLASLDALLDTLPEALDKRNPVEAGKKRAGIERKTLTDEPNLFTP